MSLPSGFLVTGDFRYLVFSLIMVWLFNLGAMVDDFS